jgi:galactonate dehydratase
VKIIGLETVRLPPLPNLLYVRVHTDAGLVGLGETYYGAAAVETVVHQDLASRIIGLDAGDRDSIRRAATGYVGYAGSGAETRARSAVDLALWDLAGQAAGLPVADLLGRVRQSIRVYNTCAGPLYMRGTSGQSSQNWGVVAGGTSGRYEDLAGFLHRPAELAEDLLAHGITAMKIWPFDRAAESSGGLGIDDAELAAGLEPLRRIRSAVGDTMGIAVELHALWQPAPALRILRAVAEFEPFWVEDPLRPDDVHGLAELRRQSSVPVAAGETLGGALAHRNLLAAEGVDVLIVDVGWVGGVTEALEVAAAAQAAGRQLALHDCSGPLVFAASVALASHLPGVDVQEFTRSYYHGWWPEIVDGLPDVADGQVRPAAGPGFGIRLRDHVLADAKTRIVGTGAFVATVPA